MQPGYRQVYKVRGSTIRSLVVLLVLLLASATMLVVLAFAQAAPQSRVVLLSFAALAGVQAVYWLRALLRTGATLEVTEDAVSLAHPNRPPLVLPWAEIDRVRWKWWRPDGFVELSARDGRSLRVDLSLEGIDEFLGMLADHLRERTPSRLPLVVLGRMRVFLLTVIFAVAASLLYLGFGSDVEQSLWRGVWIGGGSVLGAVGSLLLVLGVRRLYVDEGLILIERFFRGEALEIREISEVRLGLTRGQVKAPNVEVRFEGRLRSVLHLGAEPFTLFNAIRKAQAQSRDVSAPREP